MSSRRQMITTRVHVVMGISNVVKKCLGIGGSGSGSQYVAITAAAQARPVRKINPSSLWVWFVRCNVLAVLCIISKPCIKNSRLPVNNSP